MAINAQPKVFNVVPGNSADTVEIQDATSSTDPSISAIFPPIYQTPLSAGGKAPERTTFNTLFKEYGEHLYYLQRGGVYGYDAALDYGKGATVYYNGSIYTAIEENGPSTDTGAVAPDNASVWQKVMTNGDISDTYATKASIVDDWYAHLPINNAATHNCFYRGKDLTAAFDSGEFSEHVADGSFTDIFPGDFITKSITVNGTAYSVKWVVAHLDYYLGFPQICDSNGNITAWNTGTHHCVMLPAVPIFNAQMNPANVTDGGYAGSAIFRNTIPAVATGIVNAFGSHVVQFASFNSTAVNNSQLNGIGAGFTGSETDSYRWMTMTCDLLSESQAYGACYLSAFSGRQLSSQFAALRMSRQLLNGGDGVMWWWLKNVAASAGFAFVGNAGTAGWTGSTLSGGVRPFCLIK